MDEVGVRYTFEGEGRVRYTFENVRRRQVFGGKTTYAFI